MAQNNDVIEESSDCTSVVLYMPQNEEAWNCQWSSFVKPGIDKLRACLHGGTTFIVGIHKEDDNKDDNKDDNNNDDDSDNDSDNSDGKEDQEEDAKTKFCKFLENTPAVAAGYNDEKKIFLILNTRGYFLMPYSFIVDKEIDLVFLRQKKNEESDDADVNEVAPPDHVQIMVPGSGIQLVFPRRHLCHIYLWWYGYVSMLLCLLIIIGAIIVMLFTKL